MKQECILNNILKCPINRQIFLCTHEDNAYQKYEKYEKNQDNVTF